MAKIQSIKDVNAVVRVTKDRVTGKDVYKMVDEKKEELENKLPDVITSTEISLPDDLVGVVEHRGKHLIYTDEVGECICAMVAEGYSIKRICQFAKDGLLPNSFPTERRTVYNWIHNMRPELDNFRKMFKQARETRALVMGEDLVDEVKEIAERNPAAAMVIFRTTSWYVERVASRYFPNETKVSFPDGPPVITHFYLPENGRDQKVIDVASNVQDSIEKEDENRD